MANIALGLPIFAGREEDDLGRFIELYKGYLHTLGINPAADGGPPAGYEKANGILRACMTGPAAEWYDNNILGKRVRLRGLLTHVNHGGEAVFRALANNAVPAGTWPAGAASTAYVAANGGHLISTIWPNYNLEGNTDAWVRLADIEFTDAPLNYVTGAAGGGGALAGVAVAGQPYVINARPCHILIKLIRDLPTQQAARRQLRFGNLFQQSLPVRDFYEKVRKNGALLEYGPEIVSNQFLRGLNDECSIEAERIGPERPINELVDLLERVEKRKEELRYGRTRQETLQYNRDKNLDVVTPQEPVVLKPVKQHGISREEMDTLLKKQAEIFQTQIQDLQKNIRQRPIYKPPVITRPRPQPKPQRQPDYYDDDDPNAMYDDPDSSWGNHEEDLRILMGEDARIARKIAKKLRDAKDRREDRELTQAMRNLTLEGDEMDIDTARLGNVDLVPNDDGSFSIVSVRTLKKK
jgi:hypothetical protein